jgi:Zn-dependent M28 family amino/carboxypeptidase
MFESINQAEGVRWKLWLALSLGAAVIVLAVVSGCRITQMPLRSYDGQLSPLSTEEVETRDRLALHTAYLASTIGERNRWQAGSLHATTAYIRTQLEQSSFTVTEHSYADDGHVVANLEITVPGKPDEKQTVIVGAHYDTVRGSPGANDNATGVAALLELAHLLRQSHLRKTVRMVFFVNEEPPFFQTESMGSSVYARQLGRDHVDVSAMISLETIGFYSNAPGSQKYPPILSLFYPSRGNFIGFVGNTASRDLVRNAIRKFRESTRFPSQGIAAPDSWPGIGWSDQWSFWQEHYPAIMITDTAPFRDGYYHTPNDTADHLNLENMARVVVGVRKVVEALATER